MYIKTALLVLLLSMATFMILPSDGRCEKKYFIKFATVAPEGSAWIKQMRKLDKRFRKASKGQLGFRLYPGGIAGDELDVLRKIRIGQIHSTAFSGLGIGKTLPMARVLDLPFLFRNYHEVDLVHNRLFPFFAEAYRKKGFELLAWAEVGNVHLFSKKPIQKVSDLVGLKIWTWSGDQISKATFSQMGTIPIPLAITDVLTALNTRMIDTVYAPPLGALALQWHTQLKYMTTLPLAHSTGAVLISRRFYNQIPPALTALLQTETQVAMGALTADLRKQADESIKLIKRSGLQLTPMPTGKDLQDFYSIHQRVAQSLTGKIYPSELLDRIYGILKRPQ
ncbi:TRAP transporter substrate-binding protein DctP [Thermodesulfobacteriota bacterium]